MDGDTVTKFVLYVPLRVANTSLTSHAPGRGEGKNVGLRDLQDFDFVDSVAFVFHKHMSSSEQFIMGKYGKDHIPLCAAVSQLSNLSSFVSLIYCK